SATSGLPHLLAPAGFTPGASGGATNLFGWVATGLVEEARALAARTSLTPPHGGRRSGAGKVSLRLWVARGGSGWLPGGCVGRLGSSEFWHGTGHASLEPA